jgi:hypothetical protein
MRNSEEELFKKIVFEEKCFNKFKKNNDRPQNSLNRAECGSTAAENLTLLTRSRV